jgi:sulfonate transport system substrate-binding protein
MHLFKPRAIAYLFALLLLPLGAVRSVDAEPVTLRVGVASQLGPDTWLKAAGLDEGLPYKIEWSYFVASPAGLEALRAGHIDVVMGGGNGVLGIAARRDSIVAVSAYRNTLFTGLVVPQRSPAKSVADLRGKKITIYRAGGSHGTLAQMLASAGVGIDEVTLVNLTPADALAAFSKGEVDAWMVWDPSIAIAQSRFGARVLAVPEDDDIGQYGFHYANRAAIENPAKRAALRDYILRHVRSLEWIKSHPEQWASLQTQLARIDARAAQLSAQRTGIRYSPIDERLISNQQQYADLMVDLGVIPRKVQVRSAFDIQFNQELTTALKAQGASTALAHLDRTAAVAAR